ncbi:PTS sugar transporter subunit IIC [Neisseria sp. N95_16]|uniref:PTS sugar transporter subunit IIC n=1 Tax=Neisseria brasiliensis TaxID=2666100 RepID=A0A5Q3S2J8_9NEIS|nr:MULTISPECIES: PTS sugar transporter subunit IIC [Neisseria]MRN37818.1 PTS sugar transporter subunit IIC [Neisseria brasiliensis]PJO09812.1 PTS sugar transporter subunit IIC [Neisseria sp. N95_16]PJO78380.1 PTS sugar transporter subunit IIC [Neisseria sp. N177_16]QGL24776.1 PTS sugar transporter subunit IIC [Neisseria brasiliensis]
MNIKALLAKKDIEFSLRRYGIDALNFMALGLFGSLIIGLILKTVGGWTNLPWLVEIGGQAQAGMGAAIGVGVAYALKAPPLVLFASTIIGLAGAALGGPVGCFIAVAIGTEIGKLVSKTTPIDIIATPAATLISGMAAAQFVGPIIATAMTQTGALIMWAVELQPVLMGIIVAVLMGMILTLPISSAAVAIALSLSGLAAGAATVGCCAQMVGFAVMSFKENRWAGVLSQGLGTSMLQMPNIVKNPLIWLPPIISSAILGPLATTVFQMSNIPSGAGMGTSGLVGQVGTLDAMGGDTHIWLAIGLLHFVLPAVLTLLIAALMRKKGWIKEGDLKLDI